MLIPADKNLCLRSSADTSTITLLIPLVRLLARQAAREQMGHPSIDLNLEDVGLEGGADVR